MDERALQLFARKVGASEASTANPSGEDLDSTQTTVTTVPTTTTTVPTTTAAVPSAVGKIHLSVSESVSDSALVEAIMASFRVGSRLI